jgi:hypothetical protein
MSQRNRPGRPPLDVHEAFRSVVYGYGVEEMASKIGMPTGTLYNKANLNESTSHKPSLADALLVQTISGDTRIVEVMAHVLGGAFVKVPEINVVSDVALLEMVTEIHVQSGRFHEEIKKALEDGKFTRQEHADIYQQALFFITSVLASVKRIEGMVDD